MNGAPTSVEIRFNHDQTGTLAVPAGTLDTAVWAHLKLAIRSKNLDHTITGAEVNLSWPDTLSVVREFGSRTTQQSLNFRFRSTGAAAEKLRAFATELQEKHDAQRSTLTASVTSEEIQTRLKDAGFTKRELKPFQLRDLSHLLSLANGAKFLCPGIWQDYRDVCASCAYSKAKPDSCCRCPQRLHCKRGSMFVGECMDDNAPDGNIESFTILDGSDEDTRRALASGNYSFSSFLMDLMVRQQGVLTSHFAN